MLFCEPLAHECLLCKNFFSPSPLPVSTRTGFTRTSFCTFYLHIYQIPLHPPFLKGDYWLRLAVLHTFCKGENPCKDGLEVSAFGEYGRKWVIRRRSGDLEDLEYDSSFCGRTGQDGKK